MLSLGAVSAFAYCHEQELTAKLTVACGCSMLLEAEHLLELARCGGGLG